MSLPSLISPETVVIGDKLNHNPIINGLRLAKPSAKKIYAHLNMAEIESRLVASIGHASRILLISDGTFNMPGDHAPLADISNISYVNQ